MKHQSLWLLCLWSWSVWVTACAPPTAQSEPIVVARPEQPAWPSEVMWVRPEGIAGQLVAYDMANGSHVFSLPPGRLAADQQQYVAASQHAETTEVSLFSPANGEVTGGFVLDGRWLLAGMSPNGRWLAFRGDNEKTQGEGWQTEIVVVAGEDGRIAHTLQLDGHFEVDAISNDGIGLFLIQYVPPDQPEQYIVRLYDLAQDELLPEPLRDKRVPDEIMTGYAWGTVTDRQGQWWHTLYVSTQRNKAFIHALNLNPATRFTVCIDLPSAEGNFAALQQYALALSPDGQTIYATNPALGLVAEVNLQTFEVVRQVTFEAVAQEVSGSEPSSVMSADGSRLFFTNGHQVWAYDIIAKTVSAPYLAEAVSIQGIAVSGDGSRLVVALAGRPLQIFDAASGAALAFPGGIVAERP